MAKWRSICFAHHLGPDLLILFGGLHLGIACQPEKRGSCQVHSFIQFLDVAIEYFVKSNEYLLAFRYVSRKQYPLL